MFYVASEHALALATCFAHASRTFPRSFNMMMRLERGLLAERKSVKLCDAAMKLTQPHHVTRHETFLVAFARIRDSMTRGPDTVLIKLSLPPISQSRVGRCTEFPSVTLHDHGARRVVGRLSRARTENTKSLLCVRQCS